MIDTIANGSLGATLFGNILYTSIFYENTPQRNEYEYLNMVTLFGATLFEEYCYTI
jgi:hypothetical protein